MSESPEFVPRQLVITHQPVWDALVRLFESKQMNLICIDDALEAFAEPSEQPELPTYIYSPKEWPPH